MNEAIGRKRSVNGKTVKTFTKELYSANILEVEAGTNGYHGGDTGHGSRTYLRIQDKGGTDISVKTITGDDEGVIITLGGDCELGTIIDGLRFMADVLENQSKDTSHKDREE